MRTTTRTAGRRPARNSASPGPVPPANVLPSAIVAEGPGLPSQPGDGIEDRIISAGDGPVWSSLQPILIALFMYTVFVLIEVPYRSIHIPPTVMICIGIASAMFLGYLTLERLDWILVALLAYVPFSRLLPGDFGGFLRAFNATNMLAGAIIAGWVLRKTLRDEPFRLPAQADVPVLVFCLLAGISLIRGGLATGSIGFGSIIDLKRWMTPIAFYYLFVNNVRTRRTLVHVVFVVMIGVAIVGMMGVKEYYLDIGERSHADDQRITGISEQPNVLGAFYAYYSFFFPAFAFIYLGRRHLWWLLGPFFVNAAATFFTFSRGAVLAFGTTGYFFAFVKSRILWGMATFTVVLMVLFPEKIPSIISGRFVGTFRKPVKEASVVGAEEALEPSAKRRIRIWSDALEMVRTHPVFGVGYDRYHSITGRDAHNTFLQIGAEMGVPALLIFLVILALFFFNALWLYRTSNDLFVRATGLGFMCTIVGLFIAGNTGGRLNTLEISGYFWALGGTCMAVRRMVKEGVLR